MSTTTVVEADCVAAMRDMEAESVDAIVTDPPYGIGFMGHEWDQPGEHAPLGPDDDVELQGGKKRRSQPPAVVGAGHARERYARRNGASDTTGGAMHAGRYDLSRTANQRFQGWCEAWASEAFRVLRPGGHIVVFGGTRTYHRLACGIEDAGFELRDSLMWLFGSGFPKSLDPRQSMLALPRTTTRTEWERWYRLARSMSGTALKPGYEPIVFARKPLAGTVAMNLLEHGVGALNIDGCRIGVQDTDYARNHSGDRGHDGTRAMSERGATDLRMGGGSAADGGRWPANLILSHAEGCVHVGQKRVKAITGTAAGRMAPNYRSSVYGGYNGHAEDHGKPTGKGDVDGLETVETWECAPGCPVAALDAQSGELVSGANPTSRGSDKFRTTYGAFVGERDIVPARGVDRGGASRFYYCAKASRAERNAGLDGFEKRPILWSAGEQSPGTFQSDGTDRAARNFHPTVKPVDLMRWLVRLVTPAGGVVLDPFMGSGTTGCAAIVEGMRFVGVERDAAYCEIARARIAWWTEHPAGVETSQRLAAEREREDRALAGQSSLF